MNLTGLGRVGAIWADCHSNVCSPAMAGALSSTAPWRSVLVSPASTVAIESARAADQQGRGPDWPVQPQRPGESHATRREADRPVGNRAFRVGRVDLQPLAQST